MRQGKLRKTGAFPTKYHENRHEDLPPRPWLGYDAYALFQALHEQWAPAADQFFLSVFEV